MFPSRALAPSAFQEEEHNPEGPARSSLEEEEEEVEGGRSLDPLSALSERFPPTEDLSNTSRS